MRVKTPRRFSLSVYREFLACSESELECFWCLSVVFFWCVFDVFSDVFLVCVSGVFLVVQKFLGKFV